MWTYFRVLASCRERSVCRVCTTVREVDQSFLPCSSAGRLRPLLLAPHTPLAAPEPPPAQPPMKQAVDVARSGRPPEPSSQGPSHDSDHTLMSPRVSPALRAPAEQSEAPRAGAPRSTEVLTPETSRLPVARRDPAGQQPERATAAAQALLPSNAVSPALESPEASHAQVSEGIFPSAGTFLIAT